MSTLMEIENAVTTLPPQQQENLLLWLQTRLSAREPVTALGKAAVWLRTARGSVRQAAGKTADDLRMDYYVAKHGLES